jgi:hypothetical protein
MGTLVRSLDRVATAVAGLLLIGIGLLAFVWDRRLFFDWPNAMNLGGPLAWLRQGWVPWAAGIGGAVLVLLGLWWLLAHLPSRRLHAEPLPGSGAGGQGQVRVELKAVATRAAEDLARLPGVTSCRGRALRDRGQMVIELRPTLAADTDLATFARGADIEAARTQDVLGGTPTALRVRAQTERTR